MRFRPLIRGIFLAAVLAAGSGLVLAGCGSSGGSTTASHTPASSPGSGSGGGAVAAITANWEAFFSPRTPVARRAQLLENGHMFMSLIAAQARQPLAASASAKVTKVSDVTATKATVTYDILAAGQTALPNQTGEAVFQDGIWKVGQASFCSLLRLEKAAPPACNSAG